jgi:hypothetical protein
MQFQRVNLLEHGRGEENRKCRVTMVGKVDGTLFEIGIR